MIRWLLDKWRTHQRAIDLKILWPVCVQEAKGDRILAKTAFAVHAFNDPAWLTLGEDEIIRRIEALR